METISKGKYYYQIPATNDRFVKYQIKNNEVQVIAERPLKANSYKVRSYTHAWIDDNTLVIMSTNGKKDKILYTKLNAEDLTILAGLYSSNRLSLSNSRSSTICCLICGR